MNKTIGLYNFFGSIFLLSIITLRFSSHPNSMNLITDCLGWEYRNKSYAIAEVDAIDQRIDKGTTSNRVKLSRFRLTDER